MSNLGMLNNLIVIRGIGGAKPELFMIRLMVENSVIELP